MKKAKNAAGRSKRAAYMREWNKRNPGYTRNRDLKRFYGIGVEWYDQKLAEQDGVCAICKKAESVKIKGDLIRLPVDHSHVTGKIRGLLCSRCNRGLGLFADDPVLLQSAISYLQKYQ